MSFQELAAQAAADARLAGIGTVPSCGSLTERCICEMRLMSCSAKGLSSRFEAQHATTVGNSSLSSLPELTRTGRFRPGQRG